jgi:hypothetical protein
MLKGFYLTLMMGPTVPLLMPQPVIDALMSAQVTTSAGSASGFQLTFALSKGSILNTALLPAGAFDPGVRVILTVTVNSLPIVLMDGIITQHTVTPSSEPGQSTLSVSGQDLTLLMDLVEDEPVPYPALPVVGVINLILLRYIIYGMIPAVIPPIQLIVENPTDSWDTQAMISDLKYINTLAAEAGYVFYIEPGPLPGSNVAYFGPEIRVGVPQPALNINMDADTNVESWGVSVEGVYRPPPNHKYDSNHNSHSQCQPSASASGVAARFSIAHNQVAGHCEPRSYSRGFARAGSKHNARSDYCFRPVGRAALWAAAQSAPACGGARLRHRLRWPLLRHECYAQHQARRI